MQNAVVTVSFKEAPNVKCELKITVSAKGDISYMGTLDTPDFGAVTGVAPNADSFTDFYPYEAMEYSGTKLLRKFKNASAVREAYEKALTAAGFTLADKTSQMLGAYVTYTYTNSKTGVTVYYNEHVTLGVLRSVTIQLY